MPTQMPRKGVPRRTELRRTTVRSASTRRSSVRLRIDAPAAPTPGNTTRSAASTTSGASVTVTGTPSASNASRTLVRFPAL